MWYPAAETEKATGPVAKKRRGKKGKASQDDEGDEEEEEDPDNEEGTKKKGKELTKVQSLVEIRFQDQVAK